MPNKYNNTIYGVDIETSTIHYVNNKPYYYDGYNYTSLSGTKKLPLDIKIDKSISYMISYCISRIDFATGEYSEYSSGRAYQELNNDFVEIMNDDNLRKSIIYTHNFSYEFSFFVNNLDIFKDCEGFYIEKNQPLKVTVKDKLEFRCSYLLLNKSIKALGNDLGLPKLDFTYNKIRTPLTKLSKKERDYNFRDVEIMLKSVLKLCNENQYINQVEDIPLTKTGISRLNCKKNPKINAYTYYKTKEGQIRKNNLQFLQVWESHFEKAKNEKQLNFWENIFKGGFVFSNPKYCNAIIDNVMSFDFSSDYPYQMLYRNFPRKFYEIKLPKNRLHYFKEVCNNSTADDLITEQPYKYMINCIVKLKNLRAKTTILPLSESMFENPIKNGVEGIVLNGKIHSINTTVNISLSHIDIIILKLFYTFELVDIIYLEKCNKITPSSEYRKNCVLFNGLKKNEYKHYKELIEKINELHKYTDDEIEDTYIRDSLNQCTTYQEQVNCIGQNYQRVKADLNSLYGDNAQHLNKNNIFYDFTDREFKEDLSDFEENYLKKSKNTSYIYGLYVPAYARASILYFAYQFATKGVDTLYIDTDSLKIKASDHKKIKHIIDDYNKTVKSDITEVYNLDFGTLEYEHNIDKFVTLGSKSYIYMLNGRIYATISGLPKASELYQELFKSFDDDFEKMIDKCYHFNVCIDSTVTNKLCAIYKYDKSNVCVGNWYDTVYSGCILKPVNLVMRDLNSKTWETYATLIGDIYDVHINKNFNKIYKNKNGDLIVC